MAKDMYQKRRERKETKSNNNDQKVTTTNINWDMPTYRQPHSNPYEIRKIEK